MRSRISVLGGSASLVAALVLAVPASAASDRPDDVTAHHVASFDGLNHFIDRSLAGASIEPPEQGLCAGKGFVVESVTGVMAIYDGGGHLLKAPATLNSFYQYPPARDPLTGAFGPQLNDPTCYFDAATRRWFHAVLTVEIVPTGQFAGRPTGVNHVDIAVSRTSDPTGPWSFRHLPALNNCALGPSLPWVPNRNACLGDFPRIGADAHGFYVTTNDYGFFGTGFRSASVYAFSKHSLETNAALAVAVRFDTAGMVRGAQAGFTVSPATPSGGGESEGQGTEFFLSSNAADEVNAAHSKTSRDLVVWALSNTKSLDSATPSLHLTNTVVTVDRYSFPPSAHQMSGPVPLAECLNNTTMPTPFGLGCWRLLHLPAEPSHSWAEGQSIDTGDTRMQQVMSADGVVFGALGTAVTGSGAGAGLEWFAVQPSLRHDGELRAHLVRQGYVSSAGASLLDPAIAVGEEGTGAIAFSLMGPSNYPSAAYVPFDVKDGTGSIHIAAAGVGPDDGYTNYASAFGAPPRTRWGDYGAAVVDGSHIWMASEYIAQSCSFTQWLANPFATCGMTRAGAANWATRITEISVDR